MYSKSGRMFKSYISVPLVSVKNEKCIFIYLFSSPVTVSTITMYTSEIQVPRLVQLPAHVLVQLMLTTNAFHELLAKP